MAVRKRDKVRVETKNKYKNNMVIACIEIGSIVLVDWKQDQHKKYDETEVIEKERKPVCMRKRDLEQNEQQRNAH